MAEAREPPERCMVDTNVLVYATVDAAPRHSEARRWMSRLQHERTQLCASPQIYREYLAVLTRGDVFERTFTTGEALDALAALRPAFRELHPTSTTLEVLFDLIRHHEVRGKQVHDAGIAALMLSHGVSHLATYNQSDFERFGVELLDALS